MHRSENDEDVYTNVTNIVTGREEEQVPTLKVLRARERKVAIIHGTFRP
jgi:hypothetical protein